MERGSAQPHHRLALRQRHRLVHDAQGRSGADVDPDRSLYRPLERVRNERSDLDVGWLDECGRSHDGQDGLARVQRPTPMYAALTPTAGNVLFTGDLRGNFLVLDARTGKDTLRLRHGRPHRGRGDHLRARRQAVRRGGIRQQRWFDPADRFRHGCHLLSAGGDFPVAPYRRRGISAASGSLVTVLPNDAWVTSSRRGR